MDISVLKVLAGSVAGNPRVLVGGAYSGVTYLARFGGIKGHLFAVDLSVDDSKNAQSLAEAFRVKCYTMPRDLRWFHQCSTPEYHLFEFWCGETLRPDAEFETQSIATSLGITLDKFIG